MRFKLVTLAGERINEQVYSVQIPTIDGEIGVFPNHEPLITVAKPGVVTVKLNESDVADQHDYFAISGGIVEITGKSVKILVDEADYGDDVIEAEAQAALERAIAARDSATSAIELDKALQLVDKHKSRLKVADLHRRKRKR